MLKPLLEGFEICIMSRRGKSSRVVSNIVWKYTKSVSNGTAKAIFDGRGEGAKYYGAYQILLDQTSWLDLISFLVYARSSASAEHQEQMS